MKKNNRKTFWCLFKLILLLQLYSHLKFTTEASQISPTIRENVAQFEGNDGTNLNDRMSKMETQSRKQENEISFLKRAVFEDKKTIRHLRGRVSSLESLLMLASNSETSEKLLLRPKRPYRLLPLHKASGGERDQIEEEKATDPRFYGPAGNCEELGRLGYTLNGYYLVKGKDESNSNSVEAVLCQFKLPMEFKGGSKEQRLGFISISTYLDNTRGNVKESQTRLVSTHLTNTENELKSTERNQRGLVSIIDTTTTKPIGYEDALPHPTAERIKMGNSYCNPIGYWKNEEQDVCIHSDSLDVDKFDGVQRRRCNEGIIEQQWTINGSHICHPIKDKCFTIVKINNQSLIIGLMPYIDKEKQYQEWQWNKETGQLMSNMKTKGSSSWCMEVSTAAFHPVSGLPYMEPRQCDKNKLSQKWTFTPIMDENNDPKCTKFEERGGARRNGAKEKRLMGPSVKDVVVTKSHIGNKGGLLSTINHNPGITTLKLPVSRNFSYHALKETGPSNCNPIGYWKNEERNICISYDVSFNVGPGPIIVPRRCNGGIGQKWAMHREHICHPIEDKCFAILFRVKNKNRNVVGLLPFDEQEDQKWKLRNDDSSTHIASSYNNLCLEDADNFINGTSFIEPLQCDENKRAQKWSFAVIKDANNHPECANFSERQSKIKKI